MLSLILTQPDCHHLWWGNWPLLQTSPSRNILLFWTPRGRHWGLVQEDGVSFFQKANKARWSSGFGYEGKSAGPDEGTERGWTGVLLSLRATFTSLTYSEGMPMEYDSPTQRYQLQVNEPSRTDSVDENPWCSTESKSIRAENTKVPFRARCLHVSDTAEVRTPHPSPVHLLKMKNFCSRMRRWGGQGQTIS